MKKYLLITFLALALFSSLSAVFDEYGASPRARGMAGTYTAFSDDAMGIFYNPAGLIFAGNGFSAAHTNLYGSGFTSLTNGAFSYEMKRFGTLALGYQKFGVEYKSEDLMAENLFSIGHAVTLMSDIHSSLHFGYTFNLYNLSFGDYENDGETVEFGSENQVGINLGATAVLRQRTKLAFCVTNINNPKFGKNNEEEIPRHLSMAVSYQPYEAIVTSIEVKKEPGEDTSVRAGAEVKLHKILTLRMGIANNPAKFGTGFRVEYSNFNIDYGMNTHSVLDMTHHLGLGYKF